MTLTQKDSLKNEKDEGGRDTSKKKKKNPKSGKHLHQPRFS